MNKVARFEVEVSADDAEFLARKVAAGAAKSEEALIRHAIRMMRNRDDAIEHWLVEEVLPTYEYVKAHPESVIPAETVREELRKRFEVLRQGGK